MWCPVFNESTACGSVAGDHKGYDVVGSCGVSPPRPRQVPADALPARQRPAARISSTVRVFKRTAPSLWFRASDGSAAMRSRASSIWLAY